MTGEIFINAVGVGAGICSMSSFVPQVMKIIREHDASSISTRMYIITVIGFALWTTYGMLLKSWPLVGSNLVSLTLSGLILGLKFRYRNGPGASSVDPATPTVAA